ncbi:hypothetical protein AS189_09045 [Arthrobacter alpinus]|uniref:Uncharacterized protein n=1 Tax=Arthrobacter alpinus TaxID=656366 RepID=A0A0S2LYU5_9MICC|nr:hypothetical protein [Arthrobacter alpinus]ALO66607.1 hypothetical protein AS189_09045 [Arthrobacter alpinus]
MDTTHTARLHLELDLEFTDAGAVQAHARSWAQENAGADPETLAGMLEQASEGADAALMMLVEPSEVVAAIPGVLAVGATMWLEGPDGEPGGDFAGEGEDFGNFDDADTDTDTHDDFGDEIEESEESEEDWLNTILAAADKLPGLDLERLGCDPEETVPTLTASRLQEATVLRGAIHWAYETFIDELLGDVSTLRQNPEDAAETTQISGLPPLQAASYGPLFAQRFLAVAFDLGTALATAFEAPACVAQELALKLVLDQVEVLADLLPNLGLAEDWRSTAEDMLFEDLDHELLYVPELDGISNDPAVASAGMANLDVSAWFTPFEGRTVNPYAANE